MPDQPDWMNLPEGYRLYITDSGYYGGGFLTMSGLWVEYYVHYAGTRDCRERPNNAG